MKKKFFSKETLNRDINLLFMILSLIIVIFVLGKPWYMLLGVYLAYFIIKYFLFFGTSIGNTAYYVQSILRNDELAIKLYKLAIKCNTKSSYALTSYGLILLRAGKPKSALKLFKKILSIKTSKPLIVKYTYSNMAMCYWKLDKIDKAISIMEKMFTKYEYFNADFYTTLGFMYIVKEDYDKALEYTNKALEEDENHGPAFDNIGQVNYFLGNYEEAKQNFIKALELRDTMADSKYYLGLIYELEDNTEKAKEYFTKAHESNITGLNTVSREQVDEKYNNYN